MPTEIRSRVYSIRLFEKNGINIPIVDSKVSFACVNDMPRYAALQTETRAQTLQTVLMPCVNQLRNESFVAVVRISKTGTTYQ